MSYEIVSITERPDQAEARPATKRPARLRPGKGEALLVGMLALAACTGLLLRLPYRAPAVNALFTGGILASFYYYLRLRLKIRMPLKVLLCLVISVVIDMIGNQFGLFSQRIATIPYDTITHFTASALSFIPVMWLLRALIERFGHRLSLGFVTFFSVTTTFSLAAYYEITELLDERLFGGQRIWTPRDTVQDLAADLAGIIIAAIAYTFVIRRRERQHNLEGKRSREA
ncbi:MAG: hypothetical protein L0229_08965 [Blastocatellia bacterium]|nr:hypothetical protein [Blastocatellia bacterium]